MRAICLKGWALFGLSVCGEAFVSGPRLRLLPSSASPPPTTAPTPASAHCSRGPQRRVRVTAVESSPSVQEEREFAAKIAAVTPGPGDPTEESARRVAAATFVPEVASSQLTSEEVDIADISGRRLIMEFKALGFFKRTCQLELLKNGDTVFSKGMVAKGKGAWRIEEEDGMEYLQFSCPLTEMYSSMFDIPSSLLFWRIPLRKSVDGRIVLQGGQIISERKSLLGLRTTFIDEGTFKARVLANDEEFPIPDAVDFSSIPVPEGLKRKKGGKLADVAEPPIPGSR